MIHVFHGFLGSPEDFSFIQGSRVIHHDLYKSEKINISENDILIGYSMGGRIALELAAKNNFKLKHLYLLNAHPGLKEQSERLARILWEDEIMLKLKTQNAEDFLQDWNQLPLFKFDHPLQSISDSRYKASAELFDEYRLSKQKDFMPDIVENLDKVTWVIGLKDQKYLTLMEEVLLQNDIHVKSIDAGHRLHQHPGELLEVLKEENIL